MVAISIGPRYVCVRFPVRLLSRALIPFIIGVPMRLVALIGAVALVTACSPKDSAPAADTTAAAAVDTASGVAPMSLGHVAAIWNVAVKPEGKDSVLTTYVLN